MASSYLPLFIFFGFTLLGVVIAAVIVYNKRSQEKSEKVDKLVERVAKLQEKISETQNVAQNVIQNSVQNTPSYRTPILIPQLQGSRFFTSVRDVSPDWHPVGTMFSVDTKDDTVLTIFSRNAGYGPEYQVKVHGRGFIKLNQDRLYNGQKLIVPGLEGIGPFEVNNLDENIRIPLP